MASTGVSDVTIALAVEAGASTIAEARRLACLFSNTAGVHDAAGSFPFENFGRLHEAGLLALRTPRRYGGAEAGIGEAAGVIGAIAQGDPATALVLAMHYIHQAGFAQNPRVPASLKERLGRETAVGVSLINALRVEPELGSPARGGLPATTAVRHGGQWLISGRKIYSTGAPILAWYAVWAKTDEAQPRVGVFLIPAGLPGIRIVETWDHLGLRASGSHDVIFDGVAISTELAADIRRPDEWTAQDSQQQHVDGGILLASLYNGVARAARDWLIGFLKSRIPSNLGQPLASLPRVQESVGSIELLLSANERLIGSLTAERPGERARAIDAHVVKSLVTNHAVQAVEIAMSLAGNHGLTRANPLERHYRDVLCGRVHTPQDDSVRMALGQTALV